MIVACERCHTRFHLDDARIPKGGVQVRCSRCKHAFLLRSSAPKAPELPPRPVEAAPPASPSTPQPPAQPRSPEPSGAPAGPEPVPPPAEDGESDWEFNMDFPGADDAPEAAPAPAIPSADEDDDPDALSLEDVGDPESWDFLGEESEASAAGAAATPDPASVEAPAPLEAWEALTAAETVRQAPPGRPRTARPGSPPPDAGLGAMLGWVATALLLAVAVHGGLRVAATPATGRGPAGSVAGLELETLQGRRVENASGALLYVVSGVLRNPGPGSRAPGDVIVVGLRGEDGEPLSGQEAPAGRLLPEARLRLEEPARLRAGQARTAQALARQAIAPGETLPFDAVFESLPDEAARIAVTTMPLPADRSPGPDPSPDLDRSPAVDRTAAPETPFETGATPPAPPAGAAEAPGAARAAAGATTAASPPSAPPSSE